MTTTSTPADEKVPGLPTALEVARNALRCLYIAVDPSVARDVSDKCEMAFHALQEDSFHRANIPTELVAKSAPQEAQVAVGDDVRRDAERYRRYRIAEAIGRGCNPTSVDWCWDKALEAATAPREVAAVEPASAEEVEADILRDDVRCLSRIVGDIRSQVADLYSDRGEDERTGEVCRAVLALCKQA